MTSGSDYGKLYLCATPIGNLEDVTLRVLKILSEVDIIAAEDTRHTKKLLNHYDIHTPLTSYHEHNKHKKGQDLIDLLKTGKDVALVSDAGTPGISDPGQDIVSQAIKEGIKVFPLPGPSAVIAALICSGLNTNRFVFEGFLPRTGKERSRVISQICSEERTIVFYESPYRVIKTLQELLDKAGDRNVAVVRELTKVHEEIVRGKINEVLEHFKIHPPKGEFTIVLDGRSGSQKKQPADIDEEDILEMVNACIRKGLSKKEAIKEVSKTAQISKNRVYSAVLQGKEEFKDSEEI